MAGEIDKLIEQTNKEIEQSKRVLQDLANEVSTLADIVQPALMKQIDALRNARMTTVREIAESLVALRDIRQFFMNPDHEREMARLREFVDLCDRLKALKADGTLDALTDTILRLAGV